MRTTVTINDQLYKRIRMHAIQTGESVSAFFEEAAMQHLLEDAYDLQEIERRKNEPTITHEQLVKELKAEGLL